MGLLDVFNTFEGQQALGLLAAAGPRSDGAGFGQRLAEGLGHADKWKRGQQTNKMEEMQMQQAQMQLQEQQRQLTQQAQMQALLKKFQGQPGLAPLMGDTESGILPSAGKPATGFDYNGYAQALAGIDPLKALSLQQSLQKESTINKLDVKDFTPASVARYAQTRNYADLERMDKAHFANTGGQTTAMNPFTGQPLNSVANTQSPDSKASNAVAWANNGLSRERLSFDKAGGFDGAKPPKPEWRDGQWVVPPRDMKPGESRSVTGPTKANDAREALDVIKEAETLIPQSTGSGIGSIVDSTAGFFGAAPKGAQVGARLKALEGNLVSKMPKMSGPQSDKDVLLYKQMAGQIGDTSLPVSTRMAALETIKGIQQRYSAGSGGASGGWAEPAKSGGWSIQKAD